MAVLHCWSIVWGQESKWNPANLLHCLGSHRSGNTVWAIGLYGLNQVTARQVCQGLQQACRLGLQKINLYLVNWSATRDQNMGLKNDALFIWRRASQGALFLPCLTQKDKIMLAEYFWAHKALKSQWSQCPTGRPLDSWKLLDIRIVTCIRAVPRALLATKRSMAHPQLQIPLPQRHHGVPVELMWATGSHLRGNVLLKRSQKRTLKVSFSVVIFFIEWMCSGS